MREDWAWIGNIVDKIIEIDKEEEFDDIPIGNFGVYLLNFKSGKRYIGRSKNIRDGINRHKNQPKKGDKVISVTIFIVSSITKSEILEERLIKRLRPEYNKIFNSRKKKKINTGIWRIDVWKRYKELGLI